MSVVIFLAMQTGCDISLELNYEPVSKARDIHGRVIRVVDLESLAPHHHGLKSCQALWILSCEEAIQLA